MAGAVAIAGGIFYLFTPLTAAGPEGDPRAFGINLRYLVPALALALALLPLEPKLTPVRFRLLLAGGIAALLATSLYSDSAYIWDEAYSSIPIAALIGVVIVGVPVGIALLARRSPCRPPRPERRAPWPSLRSGGSGPAITSTPATPTPRISAFSSTNSPHGRRTRPASTSGWPA